MRRIVVREAGKDDGSDDNNEERGGDRERDGLNQGRGRRSRGRGFRGIYTDAAAAHMYRVLPKVRNNKVQTLSNR